MKFLYNLISIAGGVGYSYLVYLLLVRIESIKIILVLMSAITVIPVIAIILVKMLKLENLIFFYGGMIFGFFYLMNGFLIKI